LDANGVFLKTSLQSSLFPQDIPYCENLPKAGSMRSGYLYERPTLALRTSGKESSSWPTVQAYDCTHDGRNLQLRIATGRQMTIGDAARLWPTARAEDSECCGNHHGVQDSLGGATRDWSTPTSGHSYRQGKVAPSEGSGHGRTLGGDAVGFWGTPRANDAEKRGSIGGDPRNGVVGQAANWRTPDTRMDHPQGPRKDAKQRQLTLADQVERGLNE
jgi:hypothetical protein